MIGCHCPVCTSTDPHDKRTRPSAVISYGPTRVLVDTTPELRLQCVANGVDMVDAVVFTHGHADHIMGLDDIRPYNLKQGGVIPIYASAETLAILRRTFAYIFDDAPTSSTLPGVELHEVNGQFTVCGIGVLPVPANHGPVAVLGFRFGGAAYLTDFSSVPETSKDLLRGLDHLILDALRYVPHPMHSNVEQSLALIEELKPKHAWFTHICHDLGHVDANAKLPENVRLAYDGLVLESEIA
jgi:phosphoribosyl 1,2-cyclic phosphate phosphodiesterase